jgi:hypothetical protein
MYSSCPHSLNSSVINQKLEKVEHLLSEVSTRISKINIGAA